MHFQEHQKSVHFQEHFSGVPENEPKPAAEWLFLNVRLAIFAVV